MNKNFTKEDIKAGYIVKMRDGSLNMVTLDSRDELLMVDKDGGWMLLKYYDDNLRCTGSVNTPFTYIDPNVDIIEVYGGCRIFHHALNLDVSYRELLWKRKEEEPKKTCDDCIHKVVCNHVGMCEHFAEKR